MLKQCYSLILIVFLLAACAHQPAGTKKLPVLDTFTSRQSKHYLQVTAFNQVDVQGRINVFLHTGYKEPQAIIKGDSRDLAYVKTLVANNTLYVVLGEGYPHHGAVDLDIKGKFLNRFRYVGSGMIHGNQLHTSALDLSVTNYHGSTKLGGYIGLRQLDVGGDSLLQISGVASHYLQMRIRGNAKVQLAGEANVANLFMEGNNSLSLYWVKSDTLMIRAKKAASIYLAGAVNRLDVELWGLSQFKGRYLRAQRSFVRTHGKSVAEISSVNHQSTLATDSSDIYYFNIPGTRADFMAFDGSVLDMRDLSQHYLQEYTRYNKQFP